jgi:AcrR family transcriptional regulator
MAAGRGLFAEHGFEQVSAEQIVAAAGVTRGALYHHYRDKRALFRAVVDDLEAEVTAEVAGTAEANSDARSAMLAALGAYLECCQRPDVARILLSDAPAVLGWQTWRAIETEHGLGLVTRLLNMTLGHRRAEVAVPVLAQLVLAAVSEAALVVAHADDPAEAKTQAGSALLTLLAGLLPTD